MMPTHDDLLHEIEYDFADTATWTGRKGPAPRLRAALRRVDRAAFVPTNEIEHAYLNTPLPIGHRQTISQPYIVAIMTELLDLASDASVLEIGTGSGYQAAILAELARRVCSLEVVPELALRAAETLHRLGYTNVEVRAGDGHAGWPEAAPFDAIMITAAAAALPSALVAQLKPGGRMVVPVGAPDGNQELTLVEKTAAGETRQHLVLPVAFVPMVRG